jgi:hypothetical protein
MVKLRMRLVVSSALLLLAAVLWRAASRSDVDRSSARFDFRDDAVSTASIIDAGGSSPVRSRPAPDESGHLPLSANQPAAPLDDGRNGVGADGGAGGPAAPRASAPRFPSIENFLASEDTDEVATARLVQELTARLKELNVRGKLTGTRCDKSICEATFEFFDLAEAGRYADAASQDGRWLRIDIPGNADKRKDLPIRVYIESQPHSAIVQKYPVGAGSAEVR